MTSTSQHRAITLKIESLGAEAAALARRVHGLAEPGFEEVESSRAVAGFLEKHGFRVEWPFRKIPTAFRAEAGDGGPAIGVLGEYDALPRCGADGKSWGHGCSHHLLGVAPAAGAVAAAEVLAREGREGRVVYYGCPAEELTAGKVYMARDGAFAELDACLAWHPEEVTRIQRAGGAALDSVVYEFHGRASHAAGSPEKGRSALDAAMIMDVSVNYLREHIPDNVRIHCVVTQGGEAPNVVPAQACIWYFIRGLNRVQVNEVRARVDKCARGAALATETRVKVTRVTGLYERLRNEALHDILKRNLDAAGTEPVAAEDRKRARKLGSSGEFDTRILPDLVRPNRASTDDSNVSWLTPLGTFWYTCLPADTPVHHPQQTLLSETDYAMRAMLRAARVFAGTALDLCQDSKALASVRREFEKGTRGFVYDPLVRKNQRLPKYGAIG